MFELKTERIRQGPMPGLRKVTPHDGELLGQLMYAAYRGTVDDAGETPEQATEEAEATLRGRYGPVFWDCSFIIVRNCQAVSASIVTDWGDGGTPLLAFSMTHPDYQRKDFAAYLIRESLNALHEKGVSQLRLFVTESNTPAINLYRKLGFSRAG